MEYEIADRPQLGDEQRHEVPDTQPSRDYSSFPASRPHEVPRDRAVNIPEQEDGS